MVFVDGLALDVDATWRGIEEALAALVSSPTEGAAGRTPVPLPTVGRRDLVGALALTRSVFDPVIRGVGESDAPEGWTPFWPREGEIPVNPNPPTVALGVDGRPYPPAHAGDTSTGVGALFVCGSAPGVFGLDDAGDEFWL